MPQGQTQMLLYMSEIDLTDLLRNISFTHCFSQNRTIYGLAQVNQVSKNRYKSCDPKESTLKIEIFKFSIRIFFFSFSFINK